MEESASNAQDLSFWRSRDFVLGLAKDLHACAAIANQPAGCIGNIDLLYVAGIYSTIPIQNHCAEEQEGTPRGSAFESFLDVSVLQGALLISHLPARR